MRRAEALEEKTGRRIIHFEKGDFQGKDFSTAPNVLEVCAKALRDGHTRYVPGPGLPELRDAIAEEMTKRGRRTGRAEVLVTMGAKHALTQCLLTLVDQGDQVIIPNPGYPPDEFWITYSAGRIIYAPLDEPNYDWDLDKLTEIIEKAGSNRGWGRGVKLLIINTPQRPNGMVVKNLDDIAAICLEHGVMVLSDEIFSHRVYPPARHQSIAACKDMADQT